jgi:hypothetical protein
MAAMGGQPGGRAPLLGTLKATYISRKALEMEHLWREGCYTEDSVRHVIEGSGNKHFFYRAPQGETKALSKGGLGQYVYCAGTCTLYIILLYITLTFEVLFFTTTL